MLDFHVFELCHKWKRACFVLIFFVWIWKNFIYKNVSLSSHSLLEYRISMQAFQLTGYEFVATCIASFEVIPHFLIFSFSVHLHVLGAQLSMILESSIGTPSFRQSRWVFYKVWLIHRHFFLIISVSTNFCPPSLHRCSLLMNIQNFSQASIYKKKKFNNDLILVW